MPGPEPTIINLTWDTTSLTMPVGGTASTTVSNSITNYMQYLTSSDIDVLTSSVATSSVDGTTHTVTFTGVAAGTVTIPANTIIQSPQSVVSTNALTITVVDATPKYLDKDGLDYYDSLIATEIDGKQDTLTAGSGISISNNVISATGGGVADSVAWGHITGTMSDQTDLTTALAAKANSADLATVATSGDYDDLTDKPTIGNATLTIQKNGTSAGTFTANATSNKTINITVPTTAADISALPASTKYGASIAVSINTTDYKVTTTLKDQDGNTLGTAQVIDLPLESVVVNGSYDNTNKKIILTLQNGNTIDIPVADLVAGLQSEITSTNKLASDLVDDTNQTHKFMTSAEKTKLSGIAAGAEVNVQPDWNQTTTTADDYIKNKPSIPTKTSDLTNDSNFVSDASYVHTDNNYTTTDKNKLAGIAAGAEVNVQANWTQTTTTADDYIKNKPTLATVATSGSYNDLSNKPTIPAAQVNSDWDAASGVAQILNKPTLATVATSGSYNDLSNKPTIPTVNNATLTIQKNGTSVGTFTANASSNVTANITVPTATSDLTNDGADGTDTYVETADIANFITAEDIASTSALTPPVQTNMIADGAVTTAKIDWSTVTSANLASAAPQDITSLITPVQNSWTSRNDIKMYRYGNVIVLRFYQWWVASISANSACNLGTINTSVLGAMAPFCGSIEVINGDNGSIMNHGFIYINSSGAVSAYCPSARSGATSMRGSIAWIYV